LKKVSFYEKGKLLGYFVILLLNEKNERYSYVKPPKTLPLGQNLTFLDNLKILTFFFGKKNRRKIKKNKTVFVVVL